jgi:hypothetical protein
MAVIPETAVDQSTAIPFGKIKDALIAGRHIPASRRDGNRVTSAIGESVFYLDRKDSDGVTNRKKGYSLEFPGLVACTGHLGSNEWTVYRGYDLPAAAAAAPRPAAAAAAAAAPRPAAAAAAPRPVAAPPRNPVHAPRPRPPDNYIEFELEGVEGLFPRAEWPAEVPVLPNDPELLGLARRAVYDYWGAMFAGQGMGEVQPPVVQEILRPVQGSDPPRFLVRLRGPVPFAINNMGRPDEELFSAEAMATLMPIGFLATGHRLLERRRQMVLAGPPGTGKTHLAQAMARQALGLRPGDPLDPPETVLDVAMREPPRPPPAGRVVYRILLYRDGQGPEAPEVQLARVTFPRNASLAGLRARLLRKSAEELRRPPVTGDAEFPLARFAFVNVAKAAATTTTTTTTASGAARPDYYLVASRVRVEDESEMNVSSLESLHAGDVYVAQDAFRIVQFSAGYAYEDFVQGWRPVVQDDGRAAGQGAAMRLVNGPLMDIADDGVGPGVQAMNGSTMEIIPPAGPGSRWPPARRVLVIDEINRADLSHVFGELFYLLEHRGDGAASMRLQYDPQRAFRLPENLLIIGCMNQADHNIGHIDMALRQRFAFVQLSPEDEPGRGLLQRVLRRRLVDAADLLYGDGQAQAAAGAAGGAGAAAGPARRIDIWLPEMLDRLNGVLGVGNRVEKAARIGARFYIGLTPPAQALRGQGPDAVDQWYRTEVDETYTYQLKPYIQDACAMAGLPENRVDDVIRESNKVVSGYTVAQDYQPGDGDYQPGDGDVGEDAGGNPGDDDELDESSEQRDIGPANKKPRHY